MAMTLEELRRRAGTSTPGKTTGTQAVSQPQGATMTLDELRRKAGTTAPVRPARVQPQTSQPAQTAGEKSSAVSYAEKLAEEQKKGSFLDTLGAFGYGTLEGLRGAGENTYSAMQVSDIGNMQLADMEKRLQGIDITNPQAVSDAMKANYSRAGIESEYAKQVEREIAARTQAQGERIANLQQKYRDAPFAQDAIMVGQNIGAMLPSMAVSGITGGLAKSAGKEVAKNLSKAAFTPVFAANVFGGGIGESLNEGASLSQAGGYGVASAALETGIEAMFGGIPLLFDGIIGPEELTKKYIKTAAGRLLANRLADMTGEGVEEAASEYIQPFLKRAFYDKNAENASLADMAQAFKGGALVSAILGLPWTAGEYRQNKADIAQENAVREKATELNIDKKAAEKLTETFNEQTAGGFVQNNIDADFSMENGRYVMHKDGQTTPVTKEMFDYAQRLKAEPFKKTAVQIENNTAGINQVAEENAKPFDVSKLPQAQQGAQPSRMAEYTATLGEGKAKAEYQLNKVRGDTKTTNAQFIEDNLDAGFVQEGNRYFLEKDGKKTSITKAAYDYASYLQEQDEAQNVAQSVPVQEAVQTEIAKDINVPGKDGTDINVGDFIPRDANEEDVIKLAKDENLQATLRQRLIDSGKGSFVKYMDSFEKRTGRKAYLWSGAMADTPGFTDLKDVYFNADHPKLLETTAIHESTHLYKVNNSKKFDTVAKRMLGLVDYNKLDSKFTRTDFSTKMLYEDVYTGKNKDASIEEEVVAKLCEVCVEDPEAFLELVNRDKSIIEVVMDILREIKNSLTVMFSKDERKVEQAKIDNALLALERYLRSDVGEVSAKAETKKSKIPDERYLELAKNPQANEAELQKMVEQAAREAGYDSPLLYHGTNSEFTVFRPSAGQQGRYGAYGLYFADYDTAKGYGKTKPYYLKTKKVLKVDADGRRAVNIFTDIVSKGARGFGQDTHIDDIAYFADSNGYDGVVVENVRDNYDGDSKHIGTVYIVFDSNQIKSADPVTYDNDGNIIPLEERFNTKNPDIRFSKIANTQNKTASKTYDNSSEEQNGTGNTEKNQGSITVNAKDISSAKQTLSKVAPKKLVPGKIQAKENEKLVSSDSGFTLDETTGNMIIKPSLISLDESKDNGQLAKGKALLMEQGMSDTEADEAIKKLYDVADYQRATRPELNYEPDRFYDYIKSNSDYGFSADATTSCIRRKTFQDTYDAVLAKAARMGIAKTFDVADYIMLRRMLAQNNYKAGCGVCFVDATRMNLGVMANRFFTKHKDYVDKYGITLWHCMTPEGQIAWQKGDVPQNADIKEYVTKKDGKKIPLHEEMFNTFVKIAGSQNRPLPFSARTDYRNELLAMYLDKSGKVDEKKVAKTNAAGGFRIQSSSDFEATNALDLMQLLFDASAVGIKGQAYSKVVSFFKATRGTNLMGNISIFTKGVGIDENGNLIADNVQGVPWKTAKEIRSWQNEDGSYQFGSTLVGNTKESILKAMQEDWIDMVIPFHASGASLRSRKRLGTGEYDDFTKLQTEKIKNAKGKWVSASSNALKSVAEMPAKDVKGNIIIRDGKQVTLKEWYIEGLDKLHNWEWFVEDVSPEQNVKNYLKMCYDYGIKPKFIGTVGSKARGTSKACNFAYETDDIDVWYSDKIPVRPGYIKLLADWRRYESWTPDKDGKYKTVRHKPISTNFDIDAIKEIIEGYNVPTEKYTAEKGQFKGKEFYREKKDIATEIVDEFLFGKGNTGIVDEKQGFWKRTPTTNDILNYIGNYNEFQSMVNTYSDAIENIEKNYGEFKLDVKQLENNITKASKLMELMEIPEEYRGKSRQEVTAMIREKKAIKPKEKLVPEKFAREQAKKAEDGLPESVGAAKANPKNITHMVNEYGEMKPGEKPERFISMPVSTDGNDRVGKFARTAAEAKVTSDKMVQAIEKAVARGDFSHEIWRDKTAIDDAVAYIEKYGYGATLNEFYKRVDNKGQVTKGDMTKAMTMYAVAVENDDIKTALKLAVKINKAAVNAGQVVQSVRILKKSSPEGRLYFAQKSLEAYQDEVNEKYGSKAPELVVDDSILKALKDARTEEEIKKATTELHQVIADQLPFSWSNFITSWRYLAMLGNPRTQVRNVISNAVNSVASEYVNWIQAGIEKSTRMSTSTTTDKPTQKQIDYAKLDYQIVKEQLSGEGKYRNNSLNSIERMKNPFSFPTFWGKEGDQFVGWRGNVRKYGEPIMKGLTKWNEATSYAMEKGDLIFSEKAYVKAFARYLKANNINPAKITGEEKLDARAWATRQALESVFRENNQLANRISRLERNLVNSNSKGGKVGAVVIGGLMPFKSTPLNITKRAFEYTPLGIIKGMAEIKTNEKVYMPAAINDIAKGLSGTSLIILGAALAKYGIIKGGLGDDKEDKMAKQMGQQSYSIDTPWFSYTLDWGGAALMPLFVGADIYESNSEDDSWLMNIANALANAGSPIIETSMMTGMMDAIQSMSYEDVATEKLVAGLSSAMANYLGQFVPTLFGQVARAVDDTSRSSYTDVKGALKPLAKTAQKAQNKIPFLSKTNVPYMDVWGNNEKNFGGNVVGRLAYNMLSPGYVSAKSNDKVEKMLVDVYEKTGEKSVLPSNYTTYKRMGDETIRFTDKQYEAYTKAYGQTAYGILNDLQSDKGFKSMEDAYRAELISKVYSYSTAIASNDVVDKELTARQANQQKAMEHGLSAYEVFGGLIEADGMGSEGNANGTLSKSEVMAYIESRGGLSRTEKAYLFAALGNSNWKNPYA